MIYLYYYTIIIYLTFSNTVGRIYFYQNIFIYLKEYLQSRNDKIAQ